MKSIHVVDEARFFQSKTTRSVVMVDSQNFMFWRSKHINLRTYWICSRKNIPDKCKATAVSIGQRIIRLSGVHNHLPFDEKLKRKFIEIDPDHPIK